MTKPAIDRTLPLRVVGTHEPVLRVILENKKVWVQTACGSWQVGALTGHGLRDKNGFLIPGQSDVENIPPSPSNAEYIARIDGDKVCYCQPFSLENLSEAETNRRKYGGRIVRLVEAPSPPEPRIVERWVVVYHDASKPSGYESWNDVHLTRPRVRPHERVAKVLIEED